MARTRSIVAVGLVLATAACGTTATSNGADGPGPDGTSPPTSAGTTISTSVGSTATTGPDPTSATATNGTYGLTGTQTCRVPGGSPPVFTSPLFDGSTLTFAGDTAVVVLRNEPLNVPVTVTGTTFQVAAVFDLSGNLRTGPPSPTDLHLAVDGTFTDGGQTLTGTASDAGVNCTYTFSGTRGATTPASSTPASSSTTTAASAIADPCNHITDPTTGVAYDEWTHAGPGLGPVHLVSTCELPWAEATFEPDPRTPLIVHWDGNLWTVTDEATFCSTYTGPKPTSLPGEGQPGSIWLGHCG